MNLFTDVKIAVIVPCHNEEAAITKVVTDLFLALPDAEVYVYDNVSTDRTVELALKAGAIVRHEDIKGKGNVVRRAFADIEADVYLLIDGDDTYDVTAAPGMVEQLLNGPYDQILGVREESSTSAYRPGHSAGNRAFNALVSAIFGLRVTDMLSGYRVFSHRFVKSFPAVSHEFEIETELTVHSMSLRVPQTEVKVGFRDRPEGSESKLNTFRDGFKILGLIVNLTRHERPLVFHGVLAGLVIVGAAVLGAPVLLEFFDTGLVPRLPTALLASTLVIVGAFIGFVGMILDGITKSRRELARLTYLAYSAPGWHKGS
ncbi:glycosyltransferase [Cryobacterium sp. TMT1-62]|uniref:glycosyltransferase family 2 protein n=1 Tax=Cryobacterium sp. TMT1-62 TaxID=1259240 RepID=UPI00106D082B|nr:glycosyltransferase family 2 protein [Cryobacterium sp. TMT1-62]TFD32753.1 glycosyltransferase [Cryobacterium sp. TMT1-62]